MERKFNLLLLFALSCVSNNAEAVVLIQRLRGDADTDDEFSRKSSGVIMRRTYRTTSEVSSRFEAEVQ